MRGIRITGVLFVALTAVLVVQSARASEGVVRKRPGVWAQTYSDVAPEADIRFGALPNGMRYAIMHNATPSGQASFRFLINAGAFQERDNQGGLAHFVEHLAFKGSTHVPEGEMVKILERNGLTFGADSNASTSELQTVYRLDFPKADVDRLDTGLMLLREIAGELSLTSSAVDRERGVVLAEEQLGEGPLREIGRASKAFLLEGQLAGRRDTIGDPAVIKAATASDLRAYYEAWYRPEDAVLIAVGDFDVDAMETAVKAHFTDWRGKGAPPKAPDLGAPLKRGEAINLMIKPGVPEVLTVERVQPYDDEADALHQERRHFIEDIGFAVLNERLSRIATSSAHPFIAALAARNNAVQSARLTQLLVIAPPGKWTVALAAAIAEQRRILLSGVSPEEMARIIANERAGFVAQVASSSTRGTGALADFFVAETSSDEVITSPEANLTNFEAEVKSVTLEEVNAALRTAFSGSGPLIGMSSPSPVAGGETAIKTAFETAETAPLPQPITDVVKPWPYTNFGVPGTIISRREIVDLGITQVQFANGVRLNVKPTTFSKNNVSIDVRIGDGVLGLPVKRSAPTWLAGVVSASGTRDLTADELSKSLTGKSVGAAFGIEEDAFEISGGAAAPDLEVEFQLINALVSRPGYRQDVLERLKSAAAIVLPLVDRTAAGVAGRDVPVMLHGGDLRWQAMPTADDMSSASLAEVKDLTQKALASDPIEVTIVGDVTSARAIELVAKTLGTLPVRDAAKPLPDVARVVVPPSATATPLVLHDKGPADQALAIAIWPTTDYYSDPHTARVLAFAARVLNNRLTERLRTAEGAVYSPQAESISSRTLKGYGVLSASVALPPSKIDLFYKDLAEITADMGSKLIDADELRRVREPLLEETRRARETNGYWLDFVSGSQAEPRALDQVRLGLADRQTINPEDILSVSRRYLSHPVLET